MKKIVLVFVLLLLLTGCSTINVSNMEYESIINDTLSKEITLSNKSFEGYKIYIPRGLKIVERNDYNVQILDSDNTYYLFVDIVSYYYKVKNNFTVDSSKLLSKAINYKGKSGYIEIQKIDEKYFVEIMYNYSKIQAYLSEKNLKESVFNMIYVLSSINYNDRVIDVLIGENKLDYKEEKFDIFESKGDNNSFLEALEKYENYNEKEVEDKDSIKYEELE